MVNDWRRWQDRDEEWRIQTAQIAAAKNADDIEAKAAVGRIGEVPTITWEEAFTFFSGGLIPDEDSTHSKGNWLDRWAERNHLHYIKRVSALKRDDKLRKQNGLVLGSLGAWGAAFLTLNLGTPILWTFDLGVLGVVLLLVAVVFG